MSAKAPAICTGIYRDSKQRSLRDGVGAIRGGRAALMAMGVKVERVF
jgi:hypothetical protein